MKKLNKKGFTLIELLAVIVILAVVLVVTIPSVINTMNNARDKSLENATNTVEEWFTKQYDLATMGSTLGTTSDAAYGTFLDTLSDKKLPTTKPASGNLTKEVLTAAGISKPNENLVLGNSYVYRNGNKICVHLEAATGKSFYATDKTDHTKNSSGC